MDIVGSFDVTIDPDGWFQRDAPPEGWFDEVLLSVTNAVVTDKPLDAPIAAVCSATVELSVVRTMLAAPAGIATATSALTHATPLAVGAAGDPLWSSVKFLADFNSTTPQAGSMTLYNGATITAAAGPFGTANTAHLGATDDAIDVTFGIAASGSWTVEGWFKFNANPGLQQAFRVPVPAGALALRRTTGAGGTQMALYTPGTSGGGGPQSAYVSDGVWVHLALEYDGSTLTYYQDGVSKASYADSSYTTTPSVVVIGDNGYGGGWALDGYVSDVRVTQGVRYGGNFTPPSAKLPGPSTAPGAVAAVTASLLQTVQLSNNVPGDPLWSNVVFASHFDGTAGSTTFVDELGHAGFANASAALSSTAKFGTTSLDTTTASNAAALFAMGADTNVGTSPWTIDFFINTTSTATNKWIFELANAGYDGIAFFTDAGHNSLLLVKGITICGVSNSTFADGGWHHIALQFVGSGAYEIYVDGQKLAYTTGGITFNIDLNIYGTLVIGERYARDGYGLGAKFDDFRITKGVARYSGDFTPPTSAFVGAGVVPGAVVTATATLTTVASAGVTLAATPASVATVTAALAHATPLAAAAAAQATVAAAINQSVAILAAAVGVSTVSTATLTHGVPLAGAPVAQATATAALTDAVALAAAPTAISTAIAAVNQTVAMLSAPVSVSNVASAALALSVPMAAAPADVATVTAALTTLGNAGLAAAPVAQATATAALSDAITLAAAPAAVSTAIAAVNQTVAMLAAPVGVSNVATASLAHGVPLAAASAGQGTATGALTDAVPLAATPAALATATATLASLGSSTLSASPAAQATATADLSSKATIATAAQASATVTAGLEHTVLLAAAPAAQSTAVAAINQTVNMLTASVSVANVATASLKLAVPLASAATSIAAATPTLSGVSFVTLGAAPAAGGSVAADLGLTIAFAAATTAIATAQASAANTAQMAVAAITQAQAQADVTLAVSIAALAAASAAAASSLSSVNPVDYLTGVRRVYSKATPWSAAAAVELNRASAPIEARSGSAPVTTWRVFVQAVNQRGNSPSVGGSVAATSEKSAA